MKNSPFIFPYLLLEFQSLKEELKVRTEDLYVLLGSVYLYVFETSTEIPFKEGLIDST